MIGRQRQVTWHFGSQATVWLFLLLLFSGLADAQPSATQPAASHLLTVSKPPASLLPTDPAQGLVYVSPTELSSADIFFNADGGPVNLVYIVLDTSGDGYITFDDGPDEGAPGGVMRVKDIKARADPTFNPERDALLTGALTGIVEPKDLLILEDLGFLVVADFAEANIKVFDALNFGDVAPFFMTGDLGPVVGGEPRRPWGLAYDNAADRLFVGATDGQLLVYDTFLAEQGSSGPDRIINPTFEGQPVAHNLHELVYLDKSDTLVVTDVGAATTSDQPGFDSDGSLFLIENVGRAGGPTAVNLWLHGPASLLGNPVSLVAQGETIFVAENGLDLLLRFDGLLRRRGEVDVAPNAALSIVKPESVIFLDK